MAGIRRRVPAVAPARPARYETAWRYARVHGLPIGHYRLDGKLGRGGFGTVWSASHARMPSLRVAVKLVHEHLAADPGFQRLLQKEVEVLHGLQHPGIVAFRDLVIEPDHTAIVMELLDGLDLRHALAQGPFRPDEVARALRELLDALAVAHARGVVHRDIKPENVFLCVDGRLKLMDFGIAKVAHTTLASQSGMVSGTLDYMAPERFRQQSPPASDLYSLGLVAWELITGRMACPDSDIPAKIGWHMGRGPEDPRDLALTCPAWLARFVARLSAIEADQRPVDGAAALAEIDQVWPHPGFRGSRPVAPRGRASPESRSGAEPRALSGPTLAPGAGGSVDLPLRSKATPTWAATREPATPPASEPPPAREPTPPPATAAPLNLWRRAAPRGAGLVLGVVGITLGLAGVALAIAMAGSAEPEATVGTALGVVAILAAPGAGAFFLLAGLIDGRPLGRAFYFGVASLCAVAVSTFMPAAMLADGEDGGTAATGGICCGGIPLVLTGLLALAFLVRGLSQHRREWRAWREGR